MQYFKTLPKIIYTDKNNVSTLYTNLLARVSIIPNVLNNALAFYSYDVQDDDTPEIVAYKYYGDVGRFWMVLYCNQMMDPQWDWPLSAAQFDKYVGRKYNDAEHQIHHYEKIVTTTNRTSGTDFDIKTDVKKYVISDEEFLNLLYSTVNGIADSKTYTFDTGIVDVTIQPKAVTYYEYEYDLNESKRSIKLLNKIYADQLESEFVKLMK
jgi:hypothetical protein